MNAALTTPPHREDRVRSGTTIREMIGRLWPYFMRQKTLFFTTLGAVFATAVAARVAVTLFGYAIDHGVIANNRHVVLFVAGAYFALETGRCFMSFLHSYLFAKLGNRILYQIRDRLIEHVQRLPIRFFDENPSGRIVTRVTNDVVSLGEVFNSGIINIFASLVSLIAIVASMVAISVRMTFFTLLVAPPLLWAVVKLSNHILVVLRESKAKQAAINAFVAENINGMRILQLHDRVAANREGFQALSRDYRDQQLKSVHLYALLWPTASFFNAASVAAALAVGGLLTLENAISTGSMIAFILHVRAFMDPLHTILEKYQIFQNSLSGAERIFTLLEEPVEDQAGDGLGGQYLLSKERLRGDIDFKNLDFRYSPDLPLVLRDITLSIASGESVALVGRTGSGKSTMISLLQRFYDPSAGDLLIDGQPITSFKRRELRSRIGVVQQDAYMFRGTIAENISLGNPAIPRSQIESAAQRAGLGELSERHSGGLDAKVEERGANLSFGERQLIAFARILAYDPDILILDEATANIDSRSESLIQEAARQARRGRTSVIIAHRISTILDCDRIVVLDQGHIVETGTHSDLIRRRGPYHQLCRSQFGSRFGSRFGPQFISE